MSEAEKKRKKKKETGIEWIFYITKKTEMQRSKECVWWSKTALY